MEGNNTPNERTTEKFSVVHGWMEQPGPSHFFTVPQGPAQVYSSPRHSHSMPHWRNAGPPHYSYSPQMAYGHPQPYTMVVYAPPNQINAGLGYPAPPMPHGSAAGPYMYPQYGPYGYQHQNGPYPIESHSPQYAHPSQPYYTPAQQNYSSAGPGRSRADVQHMRQVSRADPSANHQRDKN